MDEKNKSIIKASGVLHAASVLRIYAEGRLQRKQITPKTMREIEAAVDRLKDEAVAIRNMNQ